MGTSLSLMDSCLDCRMHEVTLPTQNREVFCYNIRNVQASNDMEPQATEVGSCAFSCDVFATMALHMLHNDLLQKHLPQASHFFHLLMFSAFLIIGHLSMLTQPPRKTITTTKRLYYGPLWTHKKFHSKPRGFLPHKVLILMYDLWSEIVTVPDTPTGFISSSC